MVQMVDQLKSCVSPNFFVSESGRALSAGLLSQHAVLGCDVL